jgi:4-hydroxy-2-oxoheptanedioate aldolase
MLINPVKSKLADGQIVVGSFIYVPSAGLTEIVGLLGFDFVVIDMEHGPIDIGVAGDMVRAAEVAGVTPIIRVTHNTPHLILRALDIGALGVHVPNVSDAEGARAAVSSVKYGPQGRRGLAGVRAARYGLEGSLPEYTVSANQETMVIAHIEELQAIENLDALLGVDGIDVYYLGPTDLSNTMGIPGQTKDPRVKALVEDAIRRIAAAGKTAGCVAVDVESAKRYTDLGARYIASHAIRFMANGSRQFIEEVRS